MSIITQLIGPVTGLLDKFIEDKDQKARLAFEMATLAEKHAQESWKEQASIIREEAKSSGLASMWRPILMLVITAIVAVHYLVFPLINVVFGVDLHIDLPPELWQMLNIGVGGYIVGRSGEKIASNIKK